MIRETIHPADEAHWHALRADDLTSTDVAALFGLSPYRTRFELWHEKRAGEIVSIDDNDRMLWGRRLQDAIAAGIAEDQGLQIRPMTEYMRLQGRRLGSSFDFAIEGALPGSPYAALFDEHGPGILEIKNVDWLAFKRGWTVEDDFIEAPAHIEIQTQHQQLVSGRRWSLIGALVGGNRYELLPRLADDQAHAGILAAATGFWESIAAGRPPEPVMPGDADALIRMHQYAEPGKLYDARSDAATASRIAEYATLKRQISALEEQAKVLKADLLVTIGDAEKVLLDGYSVSAGLVGPSLGTLVTPEMVGTYVGARGGYRLFRVTAKKGAK